MLVAVWGSTAALTATYLCYVARCGAMLSADGLMLALITLMYLMTCQVVAWVWTVLLHGCKERAPRWLVWAAAGERAAAETAGGAAGGRAAAVAAALCWRSWLVCVSLGRRPK